MKTTNGIPGPDDYLNHVFGPGGLLSQQFPGYEPRSGQLALTQAVHDAILFRENLLGEASCGTGKGLGYLVPATHYAHRTGEKVVVVTANNALSEQLVTKDLPLLQKLLPWPFTFGLLKGKNNFVCRSKLVELKTADRKGDELEQLESIRDWVSDIQCTGDVSDLEFVPLPNVWSQVSTTADECEGTHCDHYDHCFSARSQRVARESDIIVTNYHLLCAHLKLVYQAGIESVLPKFKVLVGDEIHKLPDIAREFFGFRITFEMFRRASNLLRNRTGRDVANAAERLFDEIRTYRRSAKYRTRLREPIINSPIFIPPLGELQSQTAALLDEYRTYISNLLYTAESEGDPHQRKRLFAQLSKAERTTDRLTELLKETIEFLSLQKADSSVYSIEMEGKADYITLMSKPISVASSLRTMLFDPLHSVICTSATMATDGRFDFIANELGCTHYDSLIAESPFNWPKQALLVLPDMVDPTDKEGFPQAVARVTEEAIRHAKGRTLGLFTSYRNLQITYEWLLRQKCPYRVLRQGDMSRTKLVEEFKKDTSSVLLGTESFWAGIDVQGEALSCVVIDRLPFPTPDDPVMDAITVADPKGWFVNHAIPRSIIQLKQGFGRLIRSIDDKGVVVILDRRITSKAYGKMFLRSLPPVPIDDNIKSIALFLNTKTLTESEYQEYVLS